jgi:SAM-dependent methyltransferase
VASAKDFSDRDLDLVTCFDVLHDLGDPVGAATHIYRSLKPDGAWMLMEPLAGDATEDNLGPRGRVIYAISTMAYQGPYRRRSVWRWALRPEKENSLKSSRLVASRGFVASQKRRLTWSLKPDIEVFEHCANG